MSEPLFKSAHHMLAFAYRFSGGTVDRPLMSRMADKAKRTGRGLSGLDGAAQAGMILGKLKDLDRVHKAILMCRYAPRMTDCPCCGHHVPADEWMGAVRQVSDAVQLSGALSGHVVHRMVRDQLVAKYFGHKVHLQTLAAKASIHLNTVTAHRAMVSQALRGGREAGKKGLESLAMEAAEQVLYGLGLIGESDIT